MPLKSIQSRTRLRSQIWRIIIAISMIFCFRIGYNSFTLRPNESDVPLLITDNFPSSAFTVPHVPHRFAPPNPHVDENTPLFIGFTQNWLLLQQTVVSYITAGWPPSDIYVVDNTGTMFSNRLSQLTLENPFFLDYNRLEQTFGVNIITTPTLLSFSQLQNFFLYTAVKKNWTSYFWSHADVAVLSDQSDSVYLRAVADMRASTASNDWAIRFYAYDRLALVSVSAFTSVGGWDINIPYYPTDCDMYERLNLAGFHNPSPVIGQIFDVAATVEDLGVFYSVEAPGSDTWVALNKTLTTFMARKNDGGERNTWQKWQRGGQGQPFYYSAEGVLRSRQEMIALGRKVYKLKWGTNECRLQTHGSIADDQWSFKSRWWR